MGNLEISLLFQEIALLIELFDQNPKKGIIYRRAAETLEGISNLNDLINQNELQNVAGIGENLAKMIAEWVKTRHLSYLEMLKNENPYALMELSKIPGLGPKRIRTLYEQMNICSLQELETALSEGVLTEIKGFGPSLINKLKQGITNYKRYGCGDAYPFPYFVGEALSANLLARGVAEKMDFSESKYASDLNFTALSKDPEECINAFLNHYFVQIVLSESDKYARVFLKQGYDASLFVVTYRPLEEFLEDDNILFALPA